MSYFKSRAREIICNKNSKLGVGSLMQFGHLLHKLDPDPSSKGVANSDRDIGESLGNRNLGLSGLRLAPETAIGTSDLLAGVNGCHLDIVVSSWLLAPLVLTNVDDADRK